MKVGFVAKLKQGDLLEALQKRGWNQRQGAEFLGIDQSTFGHLINLNKIPASFPIEVEIKLYELTGKTVEELFPDFVRTKEFREIKRVRTVFAEVTQQTLEACGVIHQLPAPNDVVSEAQLKESIEAVLKRLTPQITFGFKSLAEANLDSETIRKIRICNGYICVEKLFQSICIYWVKLTSHTTIFYYNFERT